LTYYRLTGYNTLQNRIWFVVLKVVCFAVEAAVSRQPPKRRMPICIYPGEEYIPWRSIYDHHRWT
jgi:hypothetical protein